MLLAGVNWRAGTLKHSCLSVVVGCRMRVLVGDSCLAALGVCDDCSMEVTHDGVGERRVSHPDVMADGPCSGAPLENLNGMEEQSAPVVELQETLTEAAVVEVVGASAVGDGLRLTLEVDGEPLTIAAEGVAVVEGDLGAAKRNAKGLRGRYNRYKRPQKLSVKELKERNLPLYWNERWLRNELKRLGSYAEIARVHGFPSAVTIASFAKRKFGIEIQKGYELKRRGVYEDFDSGRYTHPELARKHGVAEATVYRWLRERREGKLRPARRGRRSKDHG